MVQDNFERALISAADAFFLLPDSIWLDYLPSGGAVRRIRAVLDRTGAEETASGGQREGYEVTVKNSAAEGIASTEIDTGADKLKLSPREGRPPVTVTVTEILDHDAAMIRLKAV